MLKVSGRRRLGRFLFARVHVDLAWAARSDSVEIVNFLKILNRFSIQIPPSSWRFLKLKAHDSSAPQHQQVSSNLGLLPRRFSAPSAATQYLQRPPPFHHTVSVPRSSRLRTCIEFLKTHIPGLHWFLVRPEVVKLLKWCAANVLYSCISPGTRAFCLLKSCKSVVLSDPQQQTAGPQVIGFMVAGSLQHLTSQSCLCCSHARCTGKDRFTFA